MSTPVQPPGTPGTTRTVPNSFTPLDVAVGGAALFLRIAGGVGRRAGALMQPLGHAALEPPAVPKPLHPARVLEAVGREGAHRRRSLGRQLSRQLDVLVPEVLGEVLRRARLTDMLLRYVDLDQVVAAVDLDAAAARLDVDRVVRRVDLDTAVERVDLDAVAARINVDDVVRRVDIEAVVDRVDVDSVVTRVDVDTVVSRVDIEAVLNRVDVDAIARRLDLDAVLDRFDLTNLVLQRVDLDVLVQAILARIDLVGLAEDVIDAVDLPGIIRESTGSMASDTVTGARLQGIAADEAVGRAVDRFLLRRGRRSTQAPSGATPTDETGPGPIPPQPDHRR
ncbi:MAG TPA: hypothetical protein VK204_12005 [Nocardioidaceae bacterium]|nr:hypothetical protein [Nocardioidaceae bacterium]